MYIIPLFYFPKNMYKSVQVYTCYTTLLFSKKYGTGRHAGGSSKWLRVGSKMKVNFAFIHFLTQNFALFFFFSEKFVVKIKFLSQFSVLANFIENIMKVYSYANRNMGKRRPIYIYYWYMYILLIYLFYYII